MKVNTDVCVYVGLCTTQKIGDDKNNAKIIILRKTLKVN